MTPVLLALAVTLAAPGPKGAPKKDASSLVGEWAVEALVVDGTPKRLPAGTAWTFTADGGAVLRVGGKAAPDRGTDRGTYTADPGKDPAEMDIDLGPGSRSRGIYRVEGDRLILCLAEGEAARPAGFDAPAGSHATRWALRRARPKE